MRDSDHSGRYLDRVLLLGLFSLFLLLPPAITFWATPERPWYLPYLVWLGLIILGAWLQRWRDRHDL